MAEVGPRSAEVATVGPIEATSNTRSGSSGILPRLESGEGGKWAGFDSRRPGQIERRNSGQRIARRFSAIIGSRSVTSRDRRAPSPPRSTNAHMKLPIAEGVWTVARPMRGFGVRENAAFLPHWLRVAYPLTPSAACSHVGVVLTRAHPVAAKLVAGPKTHARGPRLPLPIRTLFRGM